MSNGMIKEYDIRDVDVVRGLAGVVALELAPENAGLRCRIRNLNCEVSGRRTNNGWERQQGRHSRQHWNGS